VGRSVALGTIRGGFVNLVVVLAEAVVAAVAAVVAVVAVVAVLALSKGEDDKAVVVVVVILFVGTPEVPPTLRCLTIDRDRTERNCVVAAAERQ
jgi:hypothetical protein